MVFKEKIFTAVSRIMLVLALMHFHLIPLYEAGIRPSRGRMKLSKHQAEQKLFGQTAMLTKVLILQLFCNTVTELVMAVMYKDMIILILLFSR